MPRPSRPVISTAIRLVEYLNPTQNGRLASPRIAINCNRDTSSSTAATPRAAQRPARPGTSSARVGKSMTNARPSRMRRNPLSNESP